METIRLKAQLRQLIGKKVKKLRNEGSLPISLYGQATKTENLAVKTVDFTKVFQAAGRSSLVDLEIEGQPPFKILIKAVQKHPVTDEFLHADFYKIRLDEEITAEIPLKFVGQAPAVKELEGNLITNKDLLEVKCLPADLVHEIEVDISSLKTFADAIHIKDLAIPANIKVEADPEEVVVLVTPPRSEEELQAMETEAAAETEKAQIEKMEAEAKAAKVEKEEEKVEEEKPGEEKKEEGKE